MKAAFCRYTLASFFQLWCSLLTANFISTLPCKRSLFGAAQVSFCSVGEKKLVTTSQINPPDILYCVTSPEMYSFSPLGWIHQAMGSCQVSALVASLYRFCLVLFSCVLKVLITRVFLCTAPPPLWLAMSSRVVLLSCPWLFNGCTFLGWFLREFFFFSPPQTFSFSLIFVTSLFFWHVGRFLFSDPFSPAREPVFALPHRSTVPKRDF